MMPQRDDYRVQIVVGVDVTATDPSDAMHAAIAKVLAIIDASTVDGKRPAWVTGIAGGIHGIHTEDALVFKQRRRKVQP